EGIVASLTFIGVFTIPHGFSSPGRAAIALGLHAVELVLLSPLGYIFVSALARFIQSVVEKENDDWPGAFRVVVGAKSLAASLLISIVAVDFVGKVLEERPFNVTETLIEALIFVLLIAYLIVLERSQHAAADPVKRK